MIDPAQEQHLSTSPKNAAPAASPAAPQRRVEVAIAVVFEKEIPGIAERILICKRKPDTVLPGYWEFPGGKCNPDETPRACAVREVEEETGLLVRVTAALPVIEHDYPHARVRLHPFTCERISGDLELRAVAEALWVPPADVEKYHFPEANRALIRAVARGRQSLEAAAQGA